MKRLVVLVAVLTSIASLALADPAAATVPGTNGRIVFIRDTPKCEGCHLTTIDPDGTDPYRIPDAGFARWSPDGTRLATYTTTEDGRLTTMLMNPDGSDRTIFPIPDPTLNLVCVVWTPDASRLLCEGWDDAHPHRAAGVFSVDATDGQDLVRLTRNPFGGHDIPDDTSPDGTRMVFSRENPSRAHRSLGVVVADMDGSDAVRIGVWTNQIGASWSPDGTSIVFSAAGGLRTIAPDGTGSTEIHLRAGGGFVYAFDPDWSPDGTHLVFAMYLGRIDQEDLYTAAADGTQVLALTDTRRVGEFSPDWGTAPVVAGG
jgi:TolB protein